MLKKVLTISPEFNEEFIHYQPWKQIHELGKRMSTRGIEFVIATNATEKKEIEGLKIMKLSQKNLRILSEESKNKILEFQPDVIFWMANSLSGSYIKKNSIGNIPIIVYISTVHMMWKEIKNLTIKEIFQSNLLNFFTAFFPFNRMVKDLNHRNIAQIIVSNNTIKERLTQLGVHHKKIVIAPLCFEPDFKVNQLTVKRLSQKPFTLCYLGPASSLRGTDILLNTIQTLKRDGHKIQLLFLLRSPNPEKEKTIFEKLCKKKKISENVVIKAGFLSRESLVEQIINSDVIVIPTKFVWNEPPLAILEAMTLGRPVVTTNVCGLPELISDYGFLIEPTSRSLHNCIKSLIEKPETLKKTADLGKAFIESLPGWGVMTDWTINTFESILNDQNES